MDIAVESSGAVLAGSVWMPDGRPVGVVLMHPGSGPSTRDNDVYFPPIREAMLSWGYAVSSFDKRGVGESAGHYHDTSIEAQAADAARCLASLEEMFPDQAVGIFGHSQGGWVAIDVAATYGPVDFVISNSGPGVGPAAQERFRMSLHADDLTSTRRIADLFDDLVALAIDDADFDEVRAVVAAHPDALRFYTEYLEEGPDAWELEKALFVYDPEPVIQRVESPVLVIYGRAERVVPVDDSVAAFARLLPTAQIVVLPGGDHRLHDEGGRFVRGYFETLRTFLDGVSLHRLS